MNIKCRYSGLKPNCAVIVATGDGPYRSAPLGTLSPHCCQLLYPPGPHAPPACPLSEWLSLSLLTTCTSPRHCTRQHASILVGSDFCHNVLAKDAWAAAPPWCLSG